MKYLTHKTISWLFYVHGIKLNNQIIQKLILHKPKLKPSNVWCPLEGHTYLNIPVAAAGLFNYSKVPSKRGRGVKIKGESEILVKFNKRRGGQIQRGDGVEFQKIC